MQSFIVEASLVSELAWEVKMTLPLPFSPQRYKKHFSPLRLISNKIVHMNESYLMIS